MTHFLLQTRIKIFCSRNLLMPKNVLPILIHNVASLMPHVNLLQDMIKVAGLVMERVRMFGFLLQIHFSNLPGLRTLIYTFCTTAFSSKFLIFFFFFGLPIFMKQVLKPPTQSPIFYHWHNNVYCFIMIF